MAERFATDKDFKAATIRRLLEHIKELEEQSQFSRGKTLIVMEHDGYTQVFADGWTTVKLLNLLPHQDPEAEVRKLGQQWDQMYIPTNATEVARPHYMAEPNRMTHDDVVEYAERFLRSQAGPIAGLDAPSR